MADQPFNTKNHRIRIAIVIGIYVVIDILTSLFISLDDTIERTEHELTVILELHAISICSFAIVVLLTMIWSNLVGIRKQQEDGSKLERQVES